MQKAVLSKVESRLHDLEEQIEKKLKRAEQNTKQTVGQHSATGGMLNELEAKVGQLEDAHVEFAEKLMKVEKRTVGELERVVEDLRRLEGEWSSQRGQGFVAPKASSSSLGGGVFSPSSLRSGPPLSDMSQRQNQNLQSAVRDVMLALPKDAGGRQVLREVVIDSALPDIQQELERRFLDPSSSLLGRLEAVLDQKIATIGGALDARLERSAKSLVSGGSANNKYNPLHQTIADAAREQVTDALEERVGVLKQDLSDLAGRKFETLTERLEQQMNTPILHGSLLDEIRRRIKAEFGNERAVWEQRVMENCEAKLEEKAGELELDLFMSRNNSQSCRAISRSCRAISRSKTVCCREIRCGNASQPAVMLMVGNASQPARGVVGMHPEEGCESRPAGCQGESHPIHCGEIREGGGHQREGEKREVGGSVV